MLTQTVVAVDGQARATTLRTHRGIIHTPCFMPVGTRGTIRAADSLDLEGLGAQVMLANTYHLMLRPTAPVVAELGGLHQFCGWDGHILTDSGGFQVFSLAGDGSKPGNVKVDDDGVTFRSTYDGSSHRLSPERAVELQELLGADIQMQLDVCAPLPSRPEVIGQAVERTVDWGYRALQARRRLDDQLLFGIIQGGVDVALRAEAAQRCAATQVDGLGFDGFGIGGLSVGESRAEMVRAVTATTAELPTDRPRYVMGLGDPAGMVEAVAHGVDLFDCVLPTRLGRHGTVLTSEGKRNLRNARWSVDSAPIDAECSCVVCRRWSRGYLRHLFAVGEPTASRLATLHNLSWTLRWVEKMREEILAGRFAAFRADVLAVWDTAPSPG